MDFDLSIIIVNYNGQKYLKDCLNSIYKNTQNIQYEIIIIDNASTDNSCHYLKKNHPEVILIESKINLGFGKGNNEAVKKAKGNFLLLLNNDTILLNPLKEILEVYKRLYNVGFMGILMLNGNKEYSQSSGNLPNIINMFWLKHLYYQNKEFKSGAFSKKIYEVGWISGSFMIIKKSIYEDINGFDERFFMYVEDVDICKRVKDRGLKNILLSDHSYIHFGGFNTNKNYLLIEGYKKYINIHFKGLKKIAMKSSLIANAFYKYMKKK